MSERPLPKRPYRDTLILNVVLAALIVLISWATGGDLRRAAVFALFYFVIATAWAWWRFRQRLAKDDS
jgi:membrane protein implicated in regulation of membrane protease activity